MKWFNCMCSCARIVADTLNSPQTDNSTNWNIWSDLSLEHFSNRIRVLCTINIWLMSYRFCLHDHTWMWVCVISACVADCRKLLESHKDHFFSQWLNYNVPSSDISQFFVCILDASVLWYESEYTGRSKASWANYNDNIKPVSYIPLLASFR